MPLYAPELYYLCDDPECHWNGSPKAVCRFCRRQWPCPDFMAAHTEARVKREIRWIERKWHEDGEPPEWLARSVDEEYARLLARDS